MSFSTHSQLHFFSVCLHTQVGLKLCTDAYQNNIIVRSACEVARQGKRLSSARENDEFHFLFLHLYKYTGKAVIIWRRYGGRFESSLIVPTSFHVRLLRLA